MAIQEERYTSKNGITSDLNEHELDVGQYVAVSDVVAVLTQLAKNQPLMEPVAVQEKNPSKPRKNDLLSLEDKRRSLGRSSPTIPTALRENPPMKEKTLEELSQELWELKLVSLSDADYYNRQLVKLKKRLLWLTGLSVGAIATLGGTLGWVTINLTQTKHQMAQYENAIQTNRVRIEQIEGVQLVEIEQVMQSLQAQIPENLSQDLKTHQEEITTLKTDLKELETTVKAQDKALSVLVGALQGVINKPGR